MKNILLTVSLMGSLTMAATIRGPVVKRLWAKGSKSEHMAVVMKTDNGSIKLRRAGGSPFVDPELDRYVGKTWSCDGTPLGLHQFFISKCTEITDGDAEIESTLIDGGLCFNDAGCMPNEHCAISGSGAGECRENQIVGECREDADCSWPKMCIGWYCH